MFYRCSLEFTKLTFSSQKYFSFLLQLLTSDVLHDSFRHEATANPEKWMDELLAGYVTSADTGNEDLVIASRAALTEYCDASQENLDRICSSLLRNLKTRQGQDRVIVPTLEITAFLFSVGLFQRSMTVDMKNLCLQAQKAGYKSGNMRKLEACLKVYGGVAAMADRVSAGLGGVMANEVLEQRRREGITEAGRRLGALAIHPWPRVRNSVIDELWTLSLLLSSSSSSSSSSSASAEKAEMLKGKDWGTAEKGAIKTLVADLGLS